MPLLTVKEALKSPIITVRGVMRVDKRSRNREKITQNTAGTGTPLYLWHSTRTSRVGFQYPSYTGPAINYVTLKRGRGGSGQALSTAYCSHASYDQDRLTSIKIDQCKLTLRGVINHRLTLINVD